MKALSGEVDAPRPFLAGAAPHGCLCSMTYLFGLLIALGFVVWGIGMYYSWALARVWRSERAAGRGHWGPLLISSSRIPEAARPLRDRCIWSMVAFFIVWLLSVVVHPIAYPHLYSY